MPAMKGFLSTKTKNSESWVNLPFGHAQKSMALLFQDKMSFCTKVIHEMNKAAKAQMLKMNREKGKLMSSIIIGFPAK
jgi:hypothetical protein